MRPPRTGRRLIIGDPSSGGTCSSAAPSDAVSTAATWGAAVTGNVAVGVRGPWRLPAWEQVVDHCDGVHVTVGAAVAACGVALPAGHGYTMLAGWTPGATLWLRDKATGTRLLGRWDGGQQSGRWDDSPREWTPR
jgi:hypothetical protein